jgi:diguanylate cyclase (GGDEF)-like protein
LTIDAFLLVAILGAVDFATGSEIAFSVFYLIPVGLAAWYVNRGAGVVCSVESTFAWYLADTQARSEPYSSALIPIWNAATRLAMFLIVTGLLAALRQALDRESQHARIDYLTGAVNGRAFCEVANAEISRLKRYGHAFTVAFLDVDNLKTVNDRSGHGIGDELLKAMVVAMKRRLRTSDTVARLGGDEFAVLLPETNAVSARAVADKLLSTLRETISSQWPVTFSVGVLTCLTPPSSVDELIEKADALMYEVKKNGKDGIRSDVLRQAA